MNSPKLYFKYSLKYFRVAGGRAVGRKKDRRRKERWRTIKEKDYKSPSSDMFMNNFSFFVFSKFFIGIAYYFDKPEKVIKIYIYIFWL